MARPIHKDNGNLVIGVVVYEAFWPVNVGIITQVLRWTRFGSAEVRVRWYSEKRGETIMDTALLQDYAALVDEHERKAVNHRAVLEAIRRGERKR